MPTRRTLDIPLHRTGSRVQLLWWPGGRLVTLQFGVKRATLDQTSARRLRDALNEYLEQGATA